MIGVCMDFDLNVDVQDDLNVEVHCCSETSKEEISNEDEETTKKGEEMPPRHDCTNEIPKKMNLDIALGFDDYDESGGSEDPCCSISSEKANSNGDKETSKKCDGSNRMPDGHDDTSESNPMPDEDDGTNINILANEIEKKLEVGCSITDVNQCYLLYCEYARLTGFSVRMGDQRYIGRSNEIRWKEYTCSCKGLPDQKKSRHVVADYRKMVVRSNCKAKIRVGRDQLRWKITIFNKNHNHGLVDIDQSYLLRSSRKLSFGNQALLQAMHSSGIPVHKACGFMEKMAGGIQNAGFIRKDAYDHFQKTKRVTRLEDGDSMALIEFLNKKSQSDPFFFWRVEKDDEGRLMNFFYRDSRCASDYKAFGDVLSLDTTFGTNRYKLACAPFVGLNHHMTNVMFGIGFLSDERTSSFNWLLEAFLESMYGIAPKVVFTDQCKALMNAVGTKFPNAMHRLCQWHINRNAMSHFGSLCGDTSFKKNWERCMNRVETEDEFEELWNYMMNSYEISNREWFDTMYGLRRRWASVFSRNIFTAGLHATSRSEGTNKVLKECPKSSWSLYEFICAYEEVQTRWRAVERAEDTRCMWLPGQFVNDSIFLNHAATVYTRKVYKLFERECAQTLNVFIDLEKGVCLGEGNVQFKAKRVGSNSTERTIVFNHSSNCASCSCGKWEREGLLCRHILKMYFMKNIDAIPESYILKRWTKRAKSIVSPECIPATTSVMLSSMQFMHDMTRIVHGLACIESIEARKDIAETITALRDRVLTYDGGASISSSSKKKMKTANGMDFHDPKNAKERGCATAPKKPIPKKGKQVGKTQPRKRTPQKRAVVDMDLNAEP